MIIISNKIIIIITQIIETDNKIMMYAILIYFTVLNGKFGITSFIRLFIWLLSERFLNILIGTNN